ncbi:type VI secretion system contractile sheath small subunit [Trinickia caryophylli]|uniref:Type VI secretion system protein ImpB n=1 Tax=Trinickia caryophylli TaxID=28094 RepID=A0A1X7CEC9_TRICW|nr:type VI secretion system contractile sheath small subunit [Trinickia caryophylli]PMS12545.1 type VI secretion system contractile sheath small subunit [Trinickia caryophylli]TRX19750.1 type VI secretion system contractile sheath small subunit [Trinickia caryophylli]WQE12930.1 type VI secretion system contractile sheath small subunit [Trinickia caryophylli]SME94698.1 type VI secretion system protein ImpB [Trinickia caryophylli]GLU30657.1 type VI secretion system-associated protein [Trinickia 
MAKKESIQKRLQKVRPPRVQLTYEVERGDAIEVKELPFVVGVVADLAGQSEVEQPKLRDRKFVSIDRDNFDDVMKGVEPRAAYQVKNKLSDAGGTFAVDLRFRSMDDFNPDEVVSQIEPLRRLLEARTKLADLRNKLAGNDKLESLLGEVLVNTEQVRSLAGGRAEADGQDQDPNQNQKSEE